MTRIQRIFDEFKIGNQKLSRCRECGAIIERLPVWETKHWKFHNSISNEPTTTYPMYVLPVGDRRGPR